MRICVLGSGSGGNCTFVEQGSTRFLIDAGLPAKIIVERLARIQVDPGTIEAVFISHEHHDHIHGAGAFARKFKVPVYISPRALDHSPSALQRLDHRPIAADIPLQLGAVTITPFSTPHDSIDPLAFALRTNGSRVCVITDVGYLPTHVRERMQNADLLVVESNHDLEMLRNGPYPWHLKQRVLSNVGHLSNEALASFFSDYFDGTGRRVLLTHLSRQNNHPQIARLAAEQSLGRRCKDADVRLSLQDEISDVIEI